MNEREMLELKQYYFNERFSQLHSQMQILEDYHEQKINVEMVDDVEVYKPPTARKHVDTAVAHVLSLDEMVTMPYPDESKKQKELVSRLKRFGEAQMRYLNNYRASFKRHCIRHAFLYGMFCIKDNIYIPRLAPEKKDGQSWEEYISSEDYKYYEKSLERTFPFHFKLVNPKAVVWDDFDKPSFVIEKFTRKYYDIRKDSENKDWDLSRISGLKDSSDIEWWEYWTEDEVYYFCNDILVYSGENYLKMIPYIMGDAGFGFVDESDSPEKRITGLLAPALSSYRQEIKLKTAAVAGFQYGVWGREYVERPYTSDELIIDNRVGGISIIPKSLGHGFIEPPRILGDLYNFLALMEKEQESVVPKTVQGVPSRYVNTGVQTAIFIGEARLGYGGVVEAWENSMSKLLNRTLWVVKNVIKEPVGIMGNFAGKPYITIKDTEIDPDNHRYYVKLDSLTPEQRDRRIMLGIRLQMASRDGKGLSGQTICEKYYGEDWEVEQERMLVEQALSSNIIREIMAMEAAKDVGMGDYIEAAKQYAMQLQNQQALQLTPPKPPVENTFRSSDYMRTQQRYSPAETEEVITQEAMPYEYE